MNTVKFKVGDYIQGIGDWDKRIFKVAIISPKGTFYILEDIDYGECSHTTSSIDTHYYLVEKKYYVSIFGNSFHVGGYWHNEKEAIRHGKKYKDYIKTIEVELPEGCVISE